MATAKTVLGEVPANKLGRTLCHEHMLLASSAAKDDQPYRYDVETIANQIVNNAGKAITDHNIKTFIDVTPWTLGRDVELEQLVAQKLDINIIAATGFYRQQNGIPTFWQYQDEDQYEEFMVREITDGVSGGINNEKVKCGVIKIAWILEPPGDPEIAELKATHAAAHASKRTGAPIVVHCSWGWANPTRNLGLEQVQMLVDYGADPERIQISHCAGVDGKLSYLLDVVRTGAYVALPDTPFSKAYSGHEAETVAGLIGGLIRAGYGDKVLMATDGQGTWFPEVPPFPASEWTPVGHWNVVYETFLPLLRAGGVTERELEKIMIENPARLFSW